MSYEPRGREQRGIAVVTVLLIIVVLLVLGTALVAVAISHAQMTVNTEARQQAYNAAESGLADVAEQIQSGAITASSTTQNGSGTSANGVPYNWSVMFNPAATPTAAPNPLNPVSSCNAVSTTQADPGPGCVAIAPGGAFIAVTASLNGHNASVEAMANPNQNFNLGKETIALVGATWDYYIGQSQSVYASDVTFKTVGGMAYPSSSAVNDANVISDGNWYAYASTKVNGTAASVGNINQANAVTKQTGAAPFSFPSSAVLQRAQAWWIKQAKAGGCYIDTGSPGNAFSRPLIIPRGGICYVNGSIQSGSALGQSILNDGGLLVVSGQFSVTDGQPPTTSYPGFGYHLTPSCKSTCSCHKQAQVVVLDQGLLRVTRIDAEWQNNPLSGQGLPEPRGVFYSPNAPLHVMSHGSPNPVFQGVFAAQEMNLYGPVQADPCANDSVIRMGAFGITAFGED